MAFGLDQLGSATTGIQGGLGKFWEGYSGKNTRTINRAVYDPTRPDVERAQATALGSRLQQQMNGQGPSLAQTQLGQARDEMMRSQLAMGASGRGANMALANRAAAQGAAKIGMQAGRDSALLRAQEQLAAQQQYAGLINAQRQMSMQEQLGQLQASTAYENKMGDVGSAEAANRQKAYGGVMTAVGGLISAVESKTDVLPVGTVLSPPEAKTQITPIGSQIGSSVGNFGMNSGQPLQAWSAGYNVNQATSPGSAYAPAFAAGGAGQVAGGYDPKTIAALSGQQNLYADQQARQAQQGGYDPYAIDRQMMAAREQRSPASPTEVAPAGAEKSSGLAAMFSGLGTVSDPRLKEGSAPIGESLGRAAAQVQPYQFRYKPFAAAEMGVSTEPRVGAMANGGPGSLEENPIYAPAVKRGPDGLARVDAGQATMANIAVTSDLARQQEGQAARLAALEGALAKKSKPVKERQPETYEQAAGQPELPEGLGKALSERYRTPQRVARPDMAVTGPSWAQSEAARRNKEAEDQGAPWNAGWVGVEAPGYQMAHPSFERPQSATVMKPAYEREAATLGEGIRQKGELRSVEDVVGDAAAAIKNEKSPERRQSMIQATQRVLAGGGLKQNQLGLSGIASPNRVYDELKRRGVKVKKSEVVNALTAVEM